MMESGIYKITNLVNGKIYIGQSIKVNERLKSHLYTLRAESHINERLQKDFVLYGEDNFTFEQIDACIGPLLDRKEAEYILLYDALNKEKGYNVKGVMNYKALPLEKSIKIQQAFIDGFLCKEQNINAMKKRERDVPISLEWLSRHMPFTEEELKLSLNEMAHSDYQGKTPLSFSLNGDFIYLSKNEEIDLSEFFM